MPKQRIAVFAVLSLAVAGGLYAMTGAGNNKKHIPVQVAQAGKATITQKVNATGKIQPKSQVKISADVSAKIMRLGVKEGDRVEKGQMLVELDRQRYVASVENQDASVRAAQGNARLVLANRAQAERVLNRAKDLFARKLESQSAVDSAQAAYQVEVARYESALDQIEQARALLKQARDDLSKTTIYSPMAGTISALKREQGEIAIGSQFQEDVIMIVADLGEMEALVDVDENDIVHIQLNQPATIRVDALLDDVVTGRVSEVANSAKVAKPGETLQKTEFEVRVAVTSDARKLRPGMTASVDIVTDTRAGALSVPIQSVTVRTLDQLLENGRNTGNFVAGQDNYVPLVYVVEEDTARARQVKTGIQSEDLIEILAGLQEGETVVSGSYRVISRDLNDGDPVSREAPGKAGAK